MSDEPMDARDAAATEDLEPGAAEQEVSGGATAANSAPRRRLGWTGVQVPAASVGASRPFGGVSSQPSQRGMWT